jgi:hypothetical protein
MDYYLPADLMRMVFSLKVGKGEASDISDVRWNEGENARGEKRKEARDKSADYGNIASFH